MITNVLLSAAILPNSVSHRAFLKAQDIGFLVFSDDTLAELSGVVRRPKFDRYLRLENRLLFLEYIKSSCLSFEITQSISICRDPKDDKFLELALASEAHYLITGDQDLLTLTPFGFTQILPPAEFLTR